MATSIDLPAIRNITVSGRIASGASTLAKRLSKRLDWQVLNGGMLFREFTKDHGYADKRSDEFDLAYEEKVREILQTQTHQIIESHLAGFDSQNISGIYKILVICEDEHGEDKADIRIDRLVNRDEMDTEQAKHEVIVREQLNLVKWRRLYAKNDLKWVYWNKKYYDLVVNTYSHNAEESLQLTLDVIGYNQD